MGVGWKRLLQRLLVLPYILVHRSVGNDAVVLGYPNEIVTGDGAHHITDLGLQLLVTVDYGYTQLEKLILPFVIYNVNIAN
jgi:hypothetical protein